MSKVFRAYQRRSDEWPGGEYRDDRQANWVARAAAPEEATGDTGTPGTGATAASLASDDPTVPLVARRSPTGRKHRRCVPSARDRWGNTAG
jgi:hypothetical protein